MRWFKEQNVYTIARIPTFKDNVLTKAYPGWAILDTATGGVWRDQEKMGWVDGNRTEAWDYNVALAREAAAYGFDEVQFDYVRFPTDGNVHSAVYSKDNTYDNRVAAISGLLGRASEALRPLGVKVSADIFGYTSWVADDLGIGQHIEVIAPYVDVLSPMVYPSTYASGLPGEDPKYRNAIAYPYEIVNKSTERSVRRAKAVNPNIEIRPWIQDFKDYAFDYRRYTPYEIRRQMDAARDGGGRGWLLWDPAVQYTKEALVSARPAFVPNSLGQVPVLAYGEVAPDVLRDDLAWLLAQGYYPTTVRDLAQGKLSTACRRARRPSCSLSTGRRRASSSCWRADRWIRPVRWACCSISQPTTRPTSPHAARSSSIRGKMTGAIRCSARRSWPLSSSKRWLRGGSRSA